MWPQLIERKPFADIHGDRQWQKLEQKSPTTSPEPQTEKVCATFLQQQVWALKAQRHKARDAKDLQDYFALL